MYTLPPRVQDAQTPPRAWYIASITDFVQADTARVIGSLATHGQFDLLLSQKDAWLDEIEILRSSLQGLAGSIMLEFNIPRMGKRVDAILLIGPVVFVIEFKVGEVAFERSSIDQVWDYALDLKNFHAASHQAAIVPLLIPTLAENSCGLLGAVAEDKVYSPILVSPDRLRATLDIVLPQIAGEPVDSQRWYRSSYQPTPTIVEAARALYSQHSVEAIARFDAGAQNLRVTSLRIEELLDEARACRQKLICFVTGVPGAGKTLVGLNIATQRREIEDPTHAVFLSGNGPLVAVLREALARDEVQRQRNQGTRIRKSTVTESIKAFIQNVHHFRDEALIDAAPPSEHVAIFDEAQRAWDLPQTANFMRRKKNHADFSQSEPEFLVSYMNRHSDWAAIVCLVGGGQEINVGEAGISTWLDALDSQFHDWHVHISSRLTDSEYASVDALKSLERRDRVHFDERLHLAVSMRSFRAESVSAFVKALLDREPQQARQMYGEISNRYPLRVTRDLGRAKQWIREQARGSERYGLVASSKAQRLKPHAVDIRVPVDPVHWFLNERTDTRSSYYLEDAATEFQVQGLELDWACVTWDGDFRYNQSNWTFHDFRGDRWCNIKNENNRRYLRNAYRVLLTRARQGMVIFVPPGDPDDPTRLPEFYDPTFEYLIEVGLTPI